MGQRYKSFFVPFFFSLNGGSPKYAENHQWIHMKNDHSDPGRTKHSDLRFFDCFWYKSLCVFEISTRCATGSGTTGYGTAWP